MSFDNKQDPPVYGVEDLEKGPAIDEKSSEYELETEVDSDDETPLYHGKSHGGKGQFFGRGRGGKHFKHFSPGPYAAYYGQFPPPPPHHHHHHHAFGARGHHHHHHGYGFPAPPPPPPPHGVFAAQSNDPYYHPFAGKRKKRLSLKRVVFLAILALSAFVFFGLGRAYECKQMEMFHSRGHHGPEHHDFRMQEGGRHHGYKPKHRKPHHKDDDEDVEGEGFPFQHHQEGMDHKKGPAKSQDEFHDEGEESKGKSHNGAKGKDHKGNHHEGESKDEVKGQKGEAIQHKGEHKGKDHKAKGKGEHNREQVSENQAEAVSEEKKEQDQK